MAGRGFSRLGGLLRLALAVVPTADAARRCRIVPASEALALLRVWGWELAGAKSGIQARAAHHAAFVQAGDGTVLEALFLAALADVNRGRNSGGRPRWVRCGG